MKTEEENSRMVTEKLTFSEELVDFCTICGTVLPLPEFSDDSHTVEPCGIVDQDPVSFGEHSVVGGVPRHPEAFGDSSHRQVLNHDPLQRPPKPPPRQLRPGFRCGAGVLPPHLPAAGALVTTQPNQQQRGTPTQRFMGQPLGHRVPDDPAAAAAVAPLLWFHDPTLDDCSTWFDKVPDGL